MYYLLLPYYLVGNGVLGGGGPDPLIVRKEGQVFGPHIVQLD